MRKNIVISGYGGQGIMIVGGILCQAAAVEGKYSTFFPSYGAEVRGGAAKCQVKISDDYIGSPIVDNIDIFLCFTKFALLKFYKQINNSGVVIMNSNIVVDDENILNPEIKKIKVNANEIANKIGNPLSANIVILGSLIKNTCCNILKKNSVISAIEEAFQDKKNFIDLNIKAFCLGYDL